MTLIIGSQSFELAGFACEPYRGLLDAWFQCIVRTCHHAIEALNALRVLDQRSYLSRNIDLHGAGIVALPAAGFASYFIHPDIENGVLAEYTSECSIRAEVSTPEPRDVGGDYEEEG